MQITDKQRLMLERLWFIYGNSGPKSTKGNHGYIQGFLEFNEDRKDFYVQGEQNMRERGMSEERIDQWKLTDECIRAVEPILNMND